MTPAKTNPCLEGLTVDCFKHNPQWAKQAFAYRLLHTLTPKKLTKRLPKGLRVALLAPGITLPPGIELPPGTTVPPGAEIPATWTPADPTPAGTQPPPTTPPGTETTGSTPPTYTEPWAPGPVHPGIGVTPPPGDNWEAQFDNTHWQRYVMGSQPNWDGSKWVISSNASVDITVIGTWHAAYRPTKIRVTIDPAASTLQWLNLMDSDHTGIAYLEPYTNLAEVDITFTTFDILHLSFFDSNDGINITNIEFLP